jgi:hypothetical protein
MHLGYDLQEPAMPKLPTVFICRGAHCNRSRHREDLEDCLSSIAELEKVRCQRICEGPVIGAELDGTLEWFCRVDSGKARRHLVNLVADGTRPGKPLLKRRVRRRSGLLR